MSDPRLEDHAVGVELQLTELVEQRERAVVQGDAPRADALQTEIEGLQAELASTAEQIAGESWDEPVIHEESV
jgi:hypothetical protein